MILCVRHHDALNASIIMITLFSILLINTRIIRIRESQSNNIRHPNRCCHIFACKSIKLIERQKNNREEREERERPKQQLQSSPSSPLIKEVLITPKNMINLSDLLSSNGRKVIIINFMTVYCFITAIIIILGTSCVTSSQQLRTVNAIPSKVTSCIVNGSIACYCGPTDYDIDCSTPFLSGKRVKNAFRLNNQTVRLDRIEIYRTMLDNLENDTFFPASFERILIHDNNFFESIDINTFRGSEKTARIVYLNNNQLSGDRIFKSLSKLEMVEEINLSRNKVSISW